MLCGGLEGAGTARTTRKCCKCQQQLTRLPRHVLTAATGKSLARPDRVWRPSGHVCPGPIVCVGPARPSLHTRWGREPVEARLRSVCSRRPSLEPVLAQHVHCVFQKSGDEVVFWAGSRVGVVWREGLSATQLQLYASTREV